jgi:hypothetical protein
MRVAFLYNAQDHHVLHSLPIACELSRMPGTDVVVLARTPEQLKLAQRLAGLYPGNRLRFELLCPSPLLRWFRGASKWAKRASLFTNLRRLSSFDALVVAERTSIQLRHLGVRQPKFIHTFHGSSGHDRAVDPRLRKFDLLLAPSARRMQRIEIAGVQANDQVSAAEERRGCHPDPVAAPFSAVIGYTKLDLVRRLGQRQERLFQNDRPIILYNPHHWPDKSSWPMIGREVLAHFARRDDFNLIFAPHVRLFDPPARYEAQFHEFSGLEHLLIDLGSQRSIDMSYTRAADIYLGDVSSQVFEFILRPRPCIFLNPRGLPWEHDEDFSSWRLGPVVSSLNELNAALATRAQWQPEYEALQRQAAAMHFPALGTPAPLLGARAIATFLRHGELIPGWEKASDGTEEPYLEGATVIQDG